MLPLHCFNAVVQFEFEFFELGFKLNLFEVFCKKKKKTFIFSLPLFLLSAQTASPAQSALFSLSARAPTSLPRPSLARAGPSAPSPPVSPTGGSRPSGPSSSSGSSGTPAQGVPAAHAPPLLAVTRTPRCRGPRPI